MPDIVTCLLIDEEKNLLILKRGDKVTAYKGLWSGVSGYIEPDETPEITALKELREEVDLEKEDVAFINKFGPEQIVDVYEGTKYEWNIHIFLYRCLNKEKIKIDWEHTEFKWIKPQNIKRFFCLRM